jgi:pSer/pThr/pTyr-binding forkhead associated (FHA) protein
MQEFCPVCRHEVSPQDNACPKCGFKLLGSTQAFKPINTDEGLSQADATPGTRGYLRVVRGPQIGVEYNLIYDQMTVGRNPKCDIFLNDMTVSRKHATIYKKDGDFVIEDDQSFNGVWVNNHNVATKTLKQGDLVQIGKFSFIFDIQ